MTQNAAAATVLRGSSQRLTQGRPGDPTLRDLHYKSLQSFLDEALVKQFAMVLLITPFVVSLAAALVVRDQQPQPLSFTLSKLAKKSAVKTDHLSRAKNAGAQNVKLYNEGTSYNVNLGLVKQQQTVLVQLDTGSPYLWYDASKLKDTSGFNKTDVTFSIGYQDGSGAKGNFGTSSVWLDNGAEVKNFQWGLATNVTLTDNLTGIFGIGGNTKRNLSDTVPYTSFSQKLKDEGLTLSNSYSYFLNKPNATLGSLTFGGRDLAKIKGPVATLPLVTTGDNAGYDTIKTKVRLTDSDGGSGSADEFEGLLDTGTTLSFLPEGLFNNIKVESLNFQGTVGYFIDCDAPSNKYVSLWFGTTEIKIPYRDLALAAYDRNGNRTPQCYFGLQPVLPEDGFTFGDTFLRSAYVTINHDTNQASLSDINYTTNENIVPI